MYITLLGANGKTGTEVVKQALGAGHVVTALVRRPDALKEQAKLRVLMGDVRNSEDVAKAIKGADVVISALGSNSGGLLTPATEAVIAASHASGVKRFILMSGFLVKRDRLSVVAKALAQSVMKESLEDKASSEDLLRKSDLDWTIVYATVLTNNAKGLDSVRVVSTKKKFGMMNRIARADVAAWMLDEAANNHYTRQEVIISTT
jgi:putative NADH-flavin reductase